MIFMCTVGACCSLRGWRMLAPIQASQTNLDPNAPLLVF